MPSRSKPAETLPLKGVRVLVSRARKQAGALSVELKARGARVLEIPFIEIREPQSFAPMDTAIRSVLDYDWLILTSVNGVNALFRRLEKLKLRPDLFEKLKIAAIGPATKKAIEGQRLKVEVTPKEYVAEAVVEALARKVKGKRVLLVRAKVARDVIPNELRRAGANVDVVEAYETVVPEKSRGKLSDALHSLKNKPQVITFTSSSTVKNFVELIGKRAATKCFRDGVRSASIGPVTSATLREFNLPVNIQAEEYTIPGLVAAITSARETFGI
ncbi:uroporphyrinogen-III synthase [Candidatus Koribacter versatilis Ellin345]|uniref:Uroporphyrinogen-III synthase n=1 Tax=Koribacter versatilis (strain Ellin345) TaxID=204669 RepID=Q1INI7_KORVE|nr:uroporphyrinogen-III synthase [Candidatus Koribacter versatilis]ABF41563.1 uroporphyrinogen-III synthase [Candidatus Koribacter versatilis Ellin345]